MSNVRKITSARKLTTRKLTGVAPWPIILLAAPEKRGKTWTAVDGCMSTLVAGGIWFGLGENDPDEYAQIPGFDHDRFDLVEHDGTYRGLRGKLDDALADEKSAPDGPPTLWVIDSGSRLWDLLSGMAQHEMYARLARKAAQRNQPAPDVEQKPAVDLWNVAADRWGFVMDALRAHHGPVVICARMEQKAVMNEKGEPTREKEDKILAHKSLPFDVDAIVELQAPGHAVITGVRSVKLAGTEQRREMKGFTIDKLLRALGVDQSVGERKHSGIDAADKPALAAEASRGKLRELCEQHNWDLTAVAAEFAGVYDVEVKVAAAKLVDEFIAIKTAEAEKAAS